MTDASRRNRGHVAIALALLAAVALQGACAPHGANADDGGGVPGKGGASGSGGSGGVTAGTSRDCTASATIVAPSDGFITDFTDADGGASAIPSGILSIANGNGAAPVVTTTDQALHIVVNSPASSESQYLEVLLGFYTCVDANAFAGVEFSISGSFSGCTMKFGAGDVEHQDVTSGAPYATGPAGAYLPLSSIVHSQVTSTRQTSRISFDDQRYGNPPEPVDRMKLIFALWQFVVSPATAGEQSSCIADITIDDVRFFTGP